MSVLPSERPHAFCFVGCHLGIGRLVVALPLRLVNFRFLKDVGAVGVKGDGYGVGPAPQEPDRGMGCYRVTGAARYDILSLCW